MRIAYKAALGQPTGTEKGSLTLTARCGTHGFSLAAVGSVRSPDFFTCVSAKTSSANTAKAQAVALAIKTDEVRRRRSYILTDSQIACRYFTDGHVPACVARLIGATVDQEHYIIWCPGHIQKRVTIERTVQLELLLTERLSLAQIPTCYPKPPTRLAISYNTSVDNEGATPRHILGSL
ncbi:hypothetical protein HPB52_013828 [Rhipicephalus sanguineus]|uniref:Tick transposon n=1 Tax=Rhipicephalus sanguineus TaxID=34632 RepID=A0A9D4T5V4_RHISA|nr:hypothetical protein HPB52_013828 [Rhipicephalus sanguineus]